MIGTKQRATNYYTNTPRMEVAGVNFMHAGIVSTGSQSVSEAYYFFTIPPNVMIVDATFTASNGNTSTQAIVKLGTELQKTLISAAITISNGAATQTKLNIYQPLTVSDSGSLHSIPILAIVTTAPTTQTTSLSMYLQLRYVTFGKID